jgi:PadR family transcriptional regulator, regulatory protein PadR
MYNAVMYGEGVESIRTAQHVKIMQFNKDLIAASSSPMVLAILAEADSYGYAIIQRVRELSGGHLEWTDGMLYPVLHRLERLGHIEARWEVAETGRRRKYYRITSQGREQLTEERRQWQAVDAALRGIWQIHSRFISARHPASAGLCSQGV